MWARAHWLVQQRVGRRGLSGTTLRALMALAHERDARAYIKKGSLWAALIVSWTDYYFFVGAFFDLP
jgi:hypothetical protein